MHCIARSLATALVSTVTLAAWAAPGDLDPTFGVNGKVQFKRGTSDSYPTAPAISSTDEKPIAGFQAQAQNGISSAVMRFNNDATTDTGFGYLGQTSLNSGGIVQAVETSGGQIYAAMRLPFAASSPVGADLANVARFNADGSPDTTWGGGTATSQAFYAGSAAGLLAQELRAIAIGSDGKIVVVGYTTNASGVHNPVVARFNADGTLDTTFNTTGYLVFTPLGAASHTAEALYIQADGSIVVSGAGDSDGTAGFVAHVKVNGALDTAFAAGGVYTVNNGVTTTCPGVVADGTMSVVGCTQDGDFYVFRLTSTGVLDQTFDSTHKNAGGHLHHIVKIPDGRIIASGDGLPPSPAGYRFAVLALNSDGTLDTTFASSGLYLAPEAPYSYARGAVWDGSQIIVIGKQQFDANGNDIICAKLSASGVRSTVSYRNAMGSQAYFRVKAYADGSMTAFGAKMTNTAYGVNSLWGVITEFDASGNIVTGFGSAGHADFDFHLGSAGVRDFGIQSDGSFVVAGDFGDGGVGQVRAGAGRITSGGSVDTGFNAAGTPGYNWVNVNNPGGVGSQFGRNMRLQSNGQILSLASSNSSGAPRQFAIARFNTDGTLDTSYGIGGIARSSFANNTSARYMDLDAAGNAVVAGENGGTNTVRLARFLPTGALDSSFGSGGMSTISMPTGITIQLPNKVIVLPSGKILVILTGTQGGQTITGSIRVSSNGLIDPTFGAAGFQMLAPTDGQFFNTWDAHVAPNGRIVILIEGQTTSGYDRTTILRLNPNGSVDNAFGPSGQRHYTDAPGQMQWVGLDIYPNGALALAGDEQGGGDMWASVARTVPDNTLLAAYVASANDFNLDGKPDLIWSNTANGSTYVWYMNGPVLITDAFVASIDPSWKIQGVGDFDGDGHPDLVWRNTTNGNCYVWYMNGASFVTDAFLFSLPPQWVIQGVADFNADGKPDFLMRNTDPASGVGFVWFFNNNVPTGSQFLFGIDPTWKVEQVGDMNGDGQPDLLFRNSDPASGLAFAWYTTYTGGNVALGGSTPPIFSIDPAWEIVQLDDWNRDGYPDLVFRNTTSGVVFVWYMTGTTLGASDYVIQIDPSWEIVPRH